MGKQFLHGTDLSHEMINYYTVLVYAYAYSVLKLKI
jgi:hypothetical protein